MTNKKINLKDILDLHLSFSSVKYAGINCFVLAAMKDACQQILELVEENANLIVFKTDMYSHEVVETQTNQEDYAHTEYTESNDYQINVIINKKSIADTINQIE